MKRKRILLLAVTTLVAIAALAPASADAGTYRAIQCHAPLGAGHTDAVFRSTSGHYVGHADCGGRGLSVTHTEGRRRTGEGRYGKWTLSAPRGTEMVRAKARVRAKGQSSHQPRMSVAQGGRTDARLRRVRGAIHAVSWSGNGGRSLSGGLECARRSGCGHGREASFQMRRIALTLKDDTAPVVGLGGSLLTAGARRGRQVLNVTANDGGAGIRQVTVEVNGKPIATRVLDCSLSRRVATRLQPCPASPTPAFELDTRAAGFRQGPNKVRVCATDYAPRGKGNRRCETRGVRIDNLCPVANTAGAKLRARFVKRGNRITTTSGRAAIVVGSVLDASGNPVHGTEVCIAARVSAHGRPERIVTTPATGPDGRFTAKIPAGPNRRVRVAFWPDRERAVERFLTLRSRAVPRLRTRPKGDLRNGATARFKVGLPGPAKAGRRVAIEARANGRWIAIDSGRTARRGTWTGRYRFRSTTGTRRYAFRAVVPKQRGYPYARGRSKVRRIKVTGG